MPEIYFSSKSDYHSECQEKVVFKCVFIEKKKKTIVCNEFHYLE